MPARKNMPVQVKDRLTAMFALVGDQTKTLVEIFCRDDILERTMHRQRRCVVEVEHVFHMAAGYQQNMAGRDGIYVSERQSLFI